MHIRVLRVRRLNIGSPGQRQSPLQHQHQPWSVFPFRYNNPGRSIIISITYRFSFSSLSPPTLLAHSLSLARPFPRARRRGTTLHYRACNVLYDVLFIETRAVDGLRQVRTLRSLRERFIVGNTRVEEWKTQKKKTVFSFVYFSQIR